jgi:hypothetical protein
MIFAFALIASERAVSADLERPTGADFARLVCEEYLPSFTPELQRELGLASDQAAQIRAFLSAHRMRTYRTPWRQLEHKQATRASVLEVLSPTQRSRLQQIVLQHQGALCALLRPSVSAALALSATQQRQIHQLMTDYLANRAHPDRKPYSTYSERAFSVLTAPQQQSFSQLLGSAFPRGRWHRDFDPIADL